MRDHANLGVLAGFVYDDIGNRLQIARGNTTVTALTYDPISRLQSLTQDVTGSAQDLTLGFSYAPSSQIATNSRSNGAYSWTGSSGTPLTYTNDGLNRLTGVTGSGVSSSLGYDLRGNVTSIGGAITIRLGRSPRPAGHCSRRLILNRQSKKHVIHLP